MMPSKFQAISFKLNCLLQWNLKDAHAIDIKYHKKCWGNSVSTVLHQPSTAATSSRTSIAAEITAKIEFLTTTEIVMC